MSCPPARGLRRAKFGQPEINLGVIPGFGGIAAPGAPGRPAPRPSNCACSVTASMPRALALGVVARIGRAGAARCRKWTPSPTSSPPPPHALAGILDTVVLGEDMALDGPSTTRPRVRPVLPTADMREGTRAFLERRKAQFRGSSHADGTPAARAPPPGRGATTPAADAAGCRHRVTIRGFLAAVPP